MKKLLYCLAALMLFTFLKCEKEKIDGNGLHVAAQEGKNTLGFMVNGKPWTAQGNNGTANLSIDVDFGFNQSVFDIAAYRIIT